MIAHPKPGPSFPQVAQAAAQAPAAAAGVGQYLLLQPVVTALAEYERLLGGAGNATCQAGLRRFTAAVLAPHARRLVTELNATSGARVPGAAQPRDLASDFLGRLSKVRRGACRALECVRVSRGPRIAYLGFRARRCRATWRLRSWVACQRCAGKVLPGVAN